MNRKKVSAWYKSYMGNCQCSQKDKTCCGWTGHHHLPGTVKVCDVAHMVRLNFSIEQILEEMGKCIVLCNSHHSREHWDMLGPTERRRHCMNMTQEQKSQYAVKMSEITKCHWASLSPEECRELCAKMSKGQHRRFVIMTPEQKYQHGIKTSEGIRHAKFKESK